MGIDCYAKRARLSIHEVLVQQELYHYIVGGILRDRIISLLLIHVGLWIRLPFDGLVKTLPMVVFKRDILCIGLRDTFTIPGFPNLQELHLYLAGGTANEQTILQQLTGDGGSQLEI